MGKRAARLGQLWRAGGRALDAGRHGLGRRRVRRRRLGRGRLGRARGLVEQARGRVGKRAARFGELWRVGRRALAGLARILLAVARAACARRHLLVRLVDAAAERDARVARAQARRGGRINLVVVVIVVIVVEREVVGLAKPHRTRTRGRTPALDARLLARRALQVRLRRVLGLGRRALLDRLDVLLGGEVDAGTRKCRYRARLRLLRRGARLERRTARPFRRRQALRRAAPHARTCLCMVSNGYSSESTAEPSARSMARNQYERSARESSHGFAPSSTKP